MQKPSFDDAFNKAINDSLKAFEYRENNINEAYWLDKLYVQNELDGNDMLEHAYWWRIRFGNGIRAPSDGLEKSEGVVAYFNNAAIHLNEVNERIRNSNSSCSKLNSKEVAYLSEKLNNVSGNQLSWASKLLAFSFPDRDIYIYDSRVRGSVDSFLEYFNNSVTEGRRLNAAATKDNYDALVKRLEIAKRIVTKSPKFRNGVSHILQNTDICTIIRKRASNNSPNQENDVARRFVINRLLDKMLYHYPKKQLPKKSKKRA